LPLGEDNAAAEAQQATTEDRLVRKAEAADRTDFSTQRSLGQLSDRERRKILFGG
jgi:hypothetical protein